MIIEAVAMVSEHGWKFLPQYSFDAGTGSWMHATFKPREGKMTLNSVNYDLGVMQHGWKKDNSHLAPTHVDLAENVRRIARYLYETVENSENEVSNEVEPLYPSPTWEQLRWFLLPQEANCYMHGKEPVSCRQFQMPFFPGRRKLVHKVSTPGHAICHCSEPKDGTDEKTCGQRSPQQSRKGNGVRNAKADSKKRRMKSSPLS